MWKDLFKNGDFMALPQITLLAFIAVFVGVIVWTFSKRRKPHYNRMAQMPLDETPPSLTRQDASRKEER